LLSKIEQLAVEERDHPTTKLIERLENSMRKKPSLAERTALHAFNAFKEKIKMFGAGDRNSLI
jgi:hypothetical protein